MKLSLRPGMDRLVTYFAEGDLESKLRKVSILTWIVLVLSLGGALWAARLRLESAGKTAPVWKMLFAKRRG